MSDLNSLLKMFMKPDKKEVVSRPEEVNKIEKNISREVKDQTNEKTPKAQTQKNDKNKESSTKKKKTKILHDKLPDFPPNETLIPNVSKIPDFKYLSPKNVFLLDEFKANDQWENNLINWFAQLRPKIFNLTNGEGVTLKKVTALIQKGEMPKSKDACNVQDVEQILYYFERQATAFTKADLAWIFSALIFTDRLLNNEIAESLSNLLTKLIAQINSLSSREDPLYPYLMTDVSLLQKFFHL